MGDKRRSYLPAVLNSVTATTVSGRIDVAYADKITLLFTADSGESVFRVQGSIDGIHYEPAVVMIHNAPNSTTQNLQRVTSVDLTSGTELYALDLHYFGYHWIQVRADVTSGTAKCDVYIEY